MGAAPFPRSGKRKRALLISKLRAHERRHPRGDRAGHATAPAPGAAAHNAASLPRPAAHLPPPATSAAFPASAPASPSASAPAAPPAAPPATSNLIPRAATTLHHYQPSHCHLPPPPVGSGANTPQTWKPSPPIKDIYIGGGSKVQKQLMHRRRGGGLNSWQSAAGGARTRVASTQRRT